MITGEQILNDGKLWRRLKGAYFHRFDDRGAISHQGFVETVANASTLKIRYFDWFMGEPSDDDTLCKLDIERYQFYGTGDEFRQFHQTHKETRAAERAEVLSAEVQHD